MTPYEFQPYPSVRYHRTEAPVTVQNQAESDALGAEWADTPAAFADAPAADAAAAEPAAADDAAAADAPKKTSRKR